VVNIFELIDSPINAIIIIRQFEGRLTFARFVLLKEYVKHHNENGAAPYGYYCDGMPINCVCMQERCACLKQVHTSIDFEYNKSKGCHIITLKQIQLFNN